jgi:orotate phosphoribosyltransferase
VTQAQSSDGARLAREIARHLLRIGAVELRPNEPFTWSSGLKSPIYCDNRLTMSWPEVRSLIADGFAAVIRECHPDCEAVAGIATGGIPHAAWTAERLGLPMLYVREKPKGHGKTNQIEGVVRPGMKVVLIEDLISTGGSSLRAAVAMRDAGCEVLGTIAIFTYEFPQAAAAFAERGIPLRTLSSYSALLEEALESGAITEEDLGLLRSWRSDPEGYAARFTSPA